MIYPETEFLLQNSVSSAIQKGIYYSRHIITGFSNPCNGKGLIPPTVWEIPNAARCGLTNPQHFKAVSCFLKQVLKLNDASARNPATGKRVVKLSVEVEDQFNVTLLPYVVPHEN